MLTNVLVRLLQVWFFAVAAWNWANDMALLAVFRGLDLLARLLAWTLRKFGVKEEKVAELEAAVWGVATKKVAGVLDTRVRTLDEAKGFLQPDAKMVMTLGVMLLSYLPQLLVLAVTNGGALLMVVVGLVASLFARKKPEPPPEPPAPAVQPPHLTSAGSRQAA